MRHFSHQTKVHFLMSDTTKPDIASVADYSKNKAPDAARYGVGTSTREGAQAAQDARRAHSNELGSRRAIPSK
jgi:hypothetical protein